MSRGPAITGSDLARPAGYLGVDPVACDGIGMCAHLAPDLVTLDSWGYPVLLSAALERAGLAPARSAVAGCPRKALFLREDIT